MVFTDPVKYNQHFNMDQDDLYYEHKRWFEVTPEELHSELQVFNDKWPDSTERLKNWNGYWKEREVIRNKCKQYLKKDCVCINQQVAILERIDDKVVYHRYYEFKE